MSYLDIAVLILVVAAVWAVVELAVTLRHARRDVERLTASAQEVIEQAQPVVAKLDGMADELEPAVKEVTPLLRKAGGTLDAADASLGSLNAILEDVSSVSGAASSVTGAVSHAAESAVSGVASVVSRITGSRPPAPSAKLEGEVSAEPAPREEAPCRYVDYTEVAAPADAPSNQTDDVQADAAPTKEHQ